MNGTAFEELVRTLARARWNLTSGAGGATFVNGQEIDCVAETEELTHLVMCTVSRKLDKFQADVDKLVRAGRFLQQRGQTVKLWEVTYEEPTPDQKEAAKRNAVTAMSIAEFRRALINAEQYFELRSHYPFGSATDPRTLSQRLDVDEYVPSDIVESTTGFKASTQSIARELEEGRVIVLTGNFGAGKSLSLREVFFELRRRFATADKRLIPLALNLREHWGQPRPAEALERHAANLGYHKSADLVRVWNAGYAVPLLDGFDELATQSLVSHVRTKRQARFAATAIVREFVASSRGRSGLLITGRGNYFDSTDELRAALGLQAGDRILELMPFSEPQATIYLRRKGVETGLPSWLPRSPLLLGYLATSRLLQEVATIDAMDSAAQAWDEFLDRIAQRDAALGPDIDPPTVRRLLERLSTRTRLTVGGVKDLDDDDVAGAFREVVGTAAIDATHVLLQRLPGLTPRAGAEGTRAFVDGDMVEALRGSDVAHFVANPYSPLVDGSAALQHPLGPLGCEIAAHVAARLGVSVGRHVVAAQEAAQRWNEGTLALDCAVSVALRTGEPCELKGLTITDGLVETLDLEEAPVADVVLNGCYIGLLRVGDGNSRGVELQHCVISRAEGLLSKEALPDWMASCAVEALEDARTNAAILDLTIPLPVRVLLIILRKLYVQRGKGRKENALWRGLDAHAQRYVDPILEMLRAEDLAARSTLSGTSVWHGRPSARPRVLRVLAEPLTSGDPLVPQVAGLEG